MSVDMIIVGSVRYRPEDAKRLGFVGPSAVKPAQVSQGEPTKTADEKQPADPPADEKPAKGGKKEDWVAYALAHGKTEDDLKDLTRDQIAELFSDGE